MTATSRPARAGVERWLVAGALAGLVAGVAFAMFEMVVAAVMGDGFWMPLRMIGAIVLGEGALEATYSLAAAAAVGGAVHMALSALYGLVFAGIAALVPLLAAGRGVLVAAATAYGLALWLVNFYVIAPAAFPWFREASALVQFVAHAFVYGTLLGVVLAVWRPEPGPAREALAAR